MEENLKEIPITVETAKIDVPKTEPEKKLRTKYKKLLENIDNFLALQKLAKNFKANLAVFLQKNRRYSFMLLMVFNLSFGQYSIVTASNENETFGENITRMQTFDTIVNEVSLGTPTFEIPIETPKPTIKKKKETFIDKIVNFFKTLFNGNKR